MSVAELSGTEKGPFFRICVGPLCGNSPAQTYKRSRKRGNSRDNGGDGGDEAEGLLPRCCDSGGATARDSGAPFLAINKALSSTINYGKKSIPWVLMMILSSDFFSQYTTVIHQASIWIAGSLEALRSQPTHSSDSIQ